MIPLLNPNYTATADMNHGALNLPRRNGDILRKRFERLMIDRNPEFIQAIEGRLGMKKLVNQNQLLMMLEAVRHQCAVINQMQPKMQMVSADGKAMEGATMVQADLTSFVTQQLHMVLNLWPRLLAPRICSVQPLMQPSAYVFWMKIRDGSGSSAGGPTVGRDLSLLNGFDSTLADSTEGGAINNIHMSLESSLVEATWKKLKMALTIESEVKLRTQMGIEATAIMDPQLLIQLQWIIDRQVVTNMVALAGRDYYFDPDAAGTYAAKADSEKTEYDRRFWTTVVTQAQTDISSVAYANPNWAVAGTDMIAFLKRMPQYTSSHVNSGGNGGSLDMQIDSGSIISSGKVGEMDLWHDPQLDPKLLLMGHTDQGNPYNATAIFAPFGAATAATALFQDPANFVSTKARAAAYAWRGLQPNNLARVWLKKRS